ncbi:MAG: hypothetical protein ACLTDV_09790 [Eubacterium sp.]
MKRNTDSTPALMVVCIQIRILKLLKSWLEYYPSANLLLKALPPNYTSLINIQQSIPPEQLKKNNAVKSAVL